MCRASRRAWRCRHRRSRRGSPNRGTVGGPRQFGISRYCSGRSSTAPMASTNSELVKACGPVSGIRCPTRSSVSSARAATSAMSVSTIGAVEAAAYGPKTTSPARICGDHMPAKFVAKTVGRRLTQAKPESTASCSTSLLRSPRKRDGCREKSSSALIAESATNLVTPARTHWATTRLQVLTQRPGVEKHRRRARKRPGRRADRFDAGRQPGRLGRAGDRPHRGSRGGKRGDEGSPDVPGRPRYDNRHEWLLSRNFLRCSKDGAEGGKVTPENP